MIVWEAPVLGPVGSPCALTTGSPVTLHGNLLLKSPCLGFLPTTHRHFLGSSLGDYSTGITSQLNSFTGFWLKPKLSYHLPPLPMHLYPHLPVHPRLRFRTLWGPCPQSYNQKATELRLKPGTPGSQSSSTN